MLCKKQEHPKVQMTTTIKTILATVRRFVPASAASRVFLFLLFQHYLLLLS
jgi:hypothetical protein